MVEKQFQTNMFWAFLQKVAVVSEDLIGVDSRLSEHAATEKAYLPIYSKALGKKVVWSKYSADEATIRLSTVPMNKTQDSADNNTSKSVIIVFLFPLSDHFSCDHKCQP